MKTLQIYLVGGAVRDKLLGLPIIDSDWVVIGATSAKMLELKFKQVGKDFPVFLHPETHQEYALARTERKTSPGYHGFDCISDPGVTLEEDLLRRDLTINAMAQDCKGNIIDPYNGQVDLKNRVLRHVSAAFVEDPVRVLRIARFAAKLHNFGFTIAPETMQLMQNISANGELNHLVPERVWQELLKALQTQAPRIFIETLRSANALKIILPELDQLWGIPQTAKWHPEIDTGIHIMLALDEIVKLSDDPKLRFAVLCHDLGKALTPKEILPSHRGHENRGVLPIKQLAERLNIPKAYRKFAIKVAKLHLLMHSVFELRAGTILKIFEQLDAFRDCTVVADFAICCMADAKGRKGCSDKPYPQAELLQQAFLAANKITVKPLYNAGLRDNLLVNTLRGNRIKAITRVIK